jgi:hypothetical protein
MTDQPPQNREERRRAKFGRHRADARAAHDPWPTSEPNPALADSAAAGRPGPDETESSGAGSGAAAEPGDRTPQDEDSTSGAKPKG